MGDSSDNRSTQVNSCSSTDLSRFSFEADGHSPGAAPGRREIPFDPGKQVQDIIVDWDGKDDPENPFNWSNAKKWRCTIMFSLFTILSPMSSTMIIPALETVDQTFDIGNGQEKMMIMSIFMLGYAVGPFFLGPLSETYGRVKVMQGSNFFYFIFNCACALSQNKTQLLLFRFLSGMGGAAPQAIGHGYLADMWPKKYRGKSLAIYGIACWTGPCIAPIGGAYIAGNLNWRWIFWSISVLCVCIQLSAFFLLNEAYEPVLLERKARRIRKQLQAEEKPSYTRSPKDTHTVVRSKHHVKGKFKKVVLSRFCLAFTMMFTHPACYLPSLFRAYLYGLMYLLLAAWDSVWEDIYHQSKENGSLNYLSPLTGLMVSLYMTSNIIDTYHERKKQELKKLKQLARETNPDKSKLANEDEEDEEIPEWRMPPMLISAVLVPFGLLIYGWSSQYRINTVVPNISLIIIFMGLLPGFNCPAAYITDTYGKEYTASASASGAFLRTICGFSFPLFGPNFFASVGMGRGCTVLAALTLLMGIGPLAIYRWGPWLRAHSTQGMPGAKEKRDSEKVKDEEVLVEGKEMTPLSTIVPTPDKTRDAAPDNDSTGLAEEEAEVEGKTRNEDGRAILTRVAENSTDAITPLGQAQVETTQGVSRVVERAPSPAAAESSSSSSEKSNSVDSARWQTHSNGPETTPAVHPPMNASSAGDSKPDDQFVRDNDGRMLDYSLGTPSERRTRWPPKCRGIPSVACGDDGRAKEDEMPNEFQEVRSDVAVVGTRRPRFGEVRLVRMRPGSSALRRVDTGGEHVPRQSQASSIHTFELQP